MYKKSFIRGLITGLILLTGIGQGSAQVSKVWVADKGNGTYQNPIIHADYSDPDAIRVGNDYYMVSSSFNCMPGYRSFILRIW